MAANFQLPSLRLPEIWHCIEHCHLEPSAWVLGTQRSSDNGSTATGFKPKSWEWGGAQRFFGLMSRILTPLKIRNQPFLSTWEICWKMFKKHRILQGLHRVKYGDAWRPGADSNDLPTSAATRGCHVHAIAHYPTHPLQRLWYLNSTW